MPRQGANTPLPLKRSAPGSFKRMLGGTPRVPYREAWQPSAYARLVVPVLLPEQARQRGLFIEHNECVRGDQEQAYVAEQWERSVEERCSSQCKACSDVHRIANVPIRSSDHELTWRIERGGRSLADNREREDTPERKGGTGHADQNSRNLHEANRDGRDNARRLEYAPREEDQEQADKQGGVGRRTSKNERMEPLTQRTGCRLTDRP